MVIEIPEVDIVEVIGRYVDLRLKGKIHHGLCPFCKGLGFSVNQPLQLYKCFDCGAGGPVIKFIQDFEKLTFPEAVERLRENAVEQAKDEGHAAGCGHNGRV
jgi:DNA primase